MLYADTVNQDGVLELRVDVGQVVSARRERGVEVLGVALIGDQLLVVDYDVKTEQVAVTVRDGRRSAANRHIQAWLRIPVREYRPVQTLI